METEKFERICRNSGFTPLPAEQTPSGKILIAERFLLEAVQGGMVVPFPHWEMLWAMERDGVREGRTIRIEAYESSRNGVVYPVPRQSSREARVAEVLADAAEWIDCANHAGLY